MRIDRQGFVRILGAIFGLVGLWKLGTGIYRTVSYDSVRAEVVGDPVKHFHYRDSVLRSNYYTFEASYRFSLGGQHFTGHGESEYEPSDGKLWVSYLRRDPNINTPQVASDSLLEAVVFLVVAVAAWRGSTLWQTAGQPSNNRWRVP